MHFIIEFPRRKSKMELMMKIKTVQSHSPTRLSALTVRKWHILLGEKSSHISMKELRPGSTIPVRLQGELGAGENTKKQKHSCSPPGMIEGKGELLKV